MVSFKEEPPSTELQNNVDGQGVPLSRSRSRNKDNSNIHEQEYGHINTSMKFEDDIAVKHAEEDDIDEYRWMIVEEHPHSQ